MILRRLSYLFLTLLFVFGANACREDDFNDTDRKGDLSDELPVELFLDIRPAVGTKAIQNPKTSFSGNDLIHVTGTFTLTATDNDGNHKQETRYGAFYYDASAAQWQPVAASGLTWPVTAEEGMFEAYYIGTNYNPSSSGTNAGGLLTEPVETLLSAVKSNADPLHAETPEAIPYGHAVRMDFKHLCTHLSLDEIRPIYSTAFYFTAESVKKKFDDAEAGSFNNAYRLSLDPETQKLEFEFFQKEDSDGKVYVSSATATDDKTGLVSVNYFLEPGYYDTFTLSYPSSNSATAYPYLYYKYTDAPDNTRPQLDAGVSYTLNIMNSPGITIDQKKEEGEPEWDDKSDPVEVDPDEFLRCISKNEEYEYNGNKILEMTENGLELKFNVDLKFYGYKDGNHATLKEGERPIVPATVLEGNYHYIYHVGSPMFAINHGTIQNLGIKEVKIENLVVNQEDKYSDSDDGSRQGALCCRNNGFIKNIRISDVEISATVITNNDQDVENIGCILGSNTSTMQEVRLSGAWKISVGNNSTDGDGVNCNLNLGGLVGQNAGTISDVGPLEGENFSLSITNTCTGKNGAALGAFYIGGIAGTTTKNIGSVNIPAVTIDASQSTCTKSFVGLLAGTVNEGVSLAACNVADGRAQAGSIDAVNNLDSGSYLGGIAGAVVPTDKGDVITVSDCIVIAKSLDNSKANASSVINAVGGCFGRIYFAYNNDFSVSGIRLFLNEILYPAKEHYSYYGTFAGLVPSGKTWADYAGSNSITNTSGIDQEIGGDTLQ